MMERDFFRPIGEPRDERLVVFLGTERVMRSAVCSVFLLGEDGSFNAVGFFLLAAVHVLRQVRFHLHLSPRGVLQLLALCQ